jgi:pre-60S factor REI1
MFYWFLYLQVKRDFICLYCNGRCQPFQSLEAARKHMDAKGHCKLRYGDGGDDEDADLEDFYDYSSRFLSISSLCYHVDMFPL